MQSDLAGKNFVVTGATSGIGKAAAEEFSRRGANLIVVGRDRIRTEATTKELAALGSGTVSFVLGDLASQAETRRVAKEILAIFDRIDVLVNNAGAILETCEKTVDGVERTFALNHVGYFVLTQELLPNLKQNPGARIINVASDAHRVATFDAENLQSEKGYSKMGSYGMSKLCNILFTRELGKRLAGSGVTAYAMHPGVVSTRFGETGGFLLRQLYRWMAPFFRSPAKGADTIVWLATAPDVAAENGLYYYNRKHRKPNASARSDANAARLWEITESLVSGSEPRSSAVA